MRNCLQGVSQHFLHWYRYLLREATYLPDPTARDYFRQAICQRFRAYAPGKHLTRPKTVFEPERQKLLLRQCRKAFYFLARANAGDTSRLKRVLFLTYGRVGKRKHELLRPWLEPETPVDSTAVESLNTSLSEPTAPRLSIPRALKAVAQAQRTCSYAGDFSRLKNVENELPAKNNWGRPMPVRRVKNMKRKAYNSLIENVLPPLPDPEYERVRSIALGERRVEPIPKRRGHVSSTLLAEIGFQQVFREGELRRDASGHQVQRIYKKVFLLSSRIERDALADKWRVHWGTERHFLTRSPAYDAKSDDSFLFRVEPKAKANSGAYLVSG